MVSVARIPESDENFARLLLCRLKEANDQLIESVATLASATRTDLPDRVQYTRARLKISQTEFARRTIFSQVCEFVLQRVEGRSAEAVIELQRADTLLLIDTVQHLSTWTTQRVLFDWSAYRLASKSLRRHIGEAIQRERAVLYPILSNLSSNTVRYLPLAGPQLLSAGRGA